MDDNKQVLTVSRLIQDLGQFNGECEVQLGIRHIEMTVPIGGMMKGNYNDSEVVILVVDPYKVKAAFDYAKQQDLLAMKDQNMIIAESVN